jgi:hypothetical protein
LLVSDWAIIIIGTGELVLVVSALLAVPILVLWVGKKYITKLECEIFFAGSHTEHHWKCSRMVLYYLPWLLQISNP